jgi:NAD(P)-dependent dehydrogenase (short-subunit alcohol dehydrogenase family)
MLDLTGKVAVVTGGSRGIGLAIAEALVDRGASVLITARGAADVEKAAAGSRRADAGPARGVVADVRLETDCEKVVAAAVETFGRLDILINNAGIGEFVNVEEMTTAAWRAQLATNLDGVFFCCRAAIPHLKKSGGWIINVASLAARNAFAGGAAYNARKVGLLGFTEALMLEVRHAGIRVSCVMPGSVATEFGADASGGADWKLHPDDVARAVVDLLAYPARALPSRVELRPTRPPKG